MTSHAPSALLELADLLAATLDDGRVAVRAGMAWCGRCGEAIVPVTAVGVAADRITSHLVQHIEEIEFGLR